MMERLKASLRERLHPQQKRALVRILRMLTSPRNAVRVALAKHRRVGDGTFLDPSIQVLGWEHVAIGRNCVISEQSYFNTNRRRKGAVEIVVEDDCFIGRRNFFTSAELISIGRFCLTGIDCKFLGNGHTANPLLPYAVTGTHADGKMRIGTNCWLGANVTVLGNVTIGHGSIVGAGAMVTRNAPPFSLLVGAPARVVKRYDWITQTWIKPEHFSEEHSAALPEEDAYLALLAKNCPAIDLPRVAAGRSQGDLA